MPRRNRDEIDELVKEAKRFQHFQNEMERAKTRDRPPVIHPQRSQRQLEAQGWYEARTILIVRENPDHSLQPLGVYIEHLHPTYGRHLVPCPSLDTSPNQEIVSTWGDPRPRPPRVTETDEEISEIRNRFYSLLAEFSIEDQDDR